MTGEGSPGPGWWRSGNGEWYPPHMLPKGWSVGPNGVPRSFELPAATPVVTAPSPWMRLADGYRSWPLWAKVAPVAVLLLVGTAIASVALGDGNDIDAVAAIATRAAVGATTTGRASTVSIPPASVSVNGLVISAPPTVTATSVSTTARAAVGSATTSTTRANAVGVPTSTVPSPTTVPPTVGATTGSTTTRQPTTTSTTTTPTTTTPPTTTPTTTTPPTTTPTTTTPPPTTPTTTTPPPTTYVVTGTLLVDSRFDVSDGCGGSGRFSPFHNGHSIVLTGPSGEVVGQGVLTGCQWTDWLDTSGVLTAKPEFSFTMSGVVEVDSYTPQLAWKTWSTLTLDELRTAGWTLDLEVQ